MNTGRFRRLLRCIIVAIGLIQLGEVSASDELPGHVQKFFQTFCLDCHGGNKQEAERRFDQLTIPVVDDDMLIDYQDVLDQLNLGEMPPSDRPQPSDQQRRQMVQWLTGTIDHAQSNRVSQPGETVLRRLNRREYLNTLVDLLDLRTTSFDPISEFPQDEKFHHLDNHGQTLVMSGFLLSNYLKTAETVIEKAVPPLEQPQVQSWEFEDGFKQQAELDFRRLKVEKMINPNASGRLPKTMALYARPLTKRHMGTHLHLSDFVNGVPHDGFYRIEVWAEARHRQAELDRPKSMIPDEPMQLAIVPGNVTYGDLHLPQPMETELARFELTDNVIEKHVAENIWLDRGVTPRFVYPNGPSAMRAPLIQLGKELFKQQGKDGSTEAAFVEGMARAKFPQIHIHRVRIEGPFYPTWPTETQQQILGGSTFVADRNRHQIKQFLDRAYRRPCTEEEVDQILAVVGARQQMGRSPLEAFKDGLKAALCSPAFLYLDETANDQGGLGEYGIASRLSYFLWATMPDDELIKLAAEGKLSQPDIRVAQVERMLADPRSSEFLRGFLNSWLTLDALGEMPPDENMFNVYYANNLEAAMRSETQRFAKHLLDHDLSIDLFLDSDFTFVNRDLANLYQLPFAGDKEGFQKISTAGKPRGGLLGQASVLTVTANGIDTSPVVRGVWILENILGTPPSPPPPDVEPLDPDIRGATTIRQQLNRHRDNPACADCHRKIDPLGFALESFDPIGRYRSRYPSKTAIDSSGEMPDGQRFENFQEFKTILLGQREKFARALTNKLMTYALGRSLEIADRPEIDTILEQLEQHDRGFQFLVKQIVASELFVKP